MGIRITQQQSIDTAVRQAQLRQSQIGELQQKLATGLEISKPSDAPAEWGTLTTQKATIARMDIDLDNINTVRQRLNQSVSLLTEGGNQLIRARELALSGTSPTDREILAQEVSQIINSLLNIANTRDGGLHLYSGTSSDVPAFEVTKTDADGQPLAIDYTGSIDTTPVVVGVDEESAMLANGAEIFQQQSRGETKFRGTTGAASGIGTDSARGVGELIVKHTATTYASAAVTPGASSAANDTVIGAAGAHVLSIEQHPTLGAVARLNNGSPVPFDASSTDLEVRSSAGLSVFVDLSAVPPGLVADIDITSTGTLSVDGGESEVPIDFSESQVVTDAETGKITVVDSTNISQVGTERIEYSGTSGVFEALIQLRDDLRNADDWSSVEFTEIMDDRISDVIRAHDQLMEFVGEQAVELSNLETLEYRTRELQLSTQTTVIDTENADVAAVIVELQTQQNHLEFIYATTANIMSVDLLDFI